MHTDTLDRALNELSSADLAGLAVQMRYKFPDRRIDSMKLVRMMAADDRHKSIVADTLADICDKPADVVDFMQIYNAEGRCSVSHQVRKGLAMAFNKFSRMDLADYAKSVPLTLKQILFLSHAKPMDRQQEKDWSDLIEGKL